MNGGRVAPEVQILMICKEGDRRYEEGINRVIFIWQSVKISSNLDR